MSLSLSPTLPPRAAGHPMHGRVLLLDDDPLVRSSLGRFLKGRGLVVYEAASVAEGMAGCRRHAIDVAIVDHHLPDGTALDFLKQSAELLTSTIVMTGHGTIDLAVQAMQQGAAHFLQKPVAPEALLAVLEKTFWAAQNSRRLEAARRSAGATSIDPFIGSSPAIRQVRDLAFATRGADVPVLILGETGSGKGVLARWLHENSPRSREPFVDLNCAGLSRELVESDLFGHQKGAFTGATGNKPGLLEIAHRGSVFLDEIGDLDMSVQPRLLKVLEDHTFRRVGDVENREVDVRIIAATHKDLGVMSAQGLFRNDLLFRINTVTFRLPSLTERREDIADLASAVMHDLCVQRGFAPPRLSDEALHSLQNHPWRGNMREMRNILERALLFHQGGELQAKSLHLDISAPPSSGHSAQSLRDGEVLAIERALQETGGKVVEAAARLGIPRSSLYAKMKRYGIERSGR